MSMEVTVEDVYTALDGDVVDRSEKFIASKLEEALAMLAGYCPRLANIIEGKEEPDKLTAVRIRLLSWPPSCELLRMTARGTSPRKSPHTRFRLTA